MKRILNSILGGCILLNAACVNEIHTDVQEGNVPITFSVKIQKPTTKVTDTDFETGDEIGLYAVLTGKSISEEEPYINNLLLTCGEEGILTSEKDVFYPEGDNALDFIAYHPYQPEGVETGTATIPVSIQTDQSDAKSYSISDFLTASETQVKSSEKSVSLNFSHRLTKLKINLVPAEGVSADIMLEDNPRIVATGFYTRANYYLEEQEFGELGGISDIVPNGTWKKDEESGNLTGKEMILIPQEIDGSQAFQMEWNGRVYTCPMPDVKNTEGSKQYELNITTEESESHILSGVVASINAWDTGDEWEGVETEEGTAALHLSALPFEKSNVYRVHINGKEVAEICKEYLFSEDLDSRAIIAYPLTKDGLADLTQGTVLQLLDTNEDINGEIIRWDTSKNTFTYKGGNLPPIQAIYFKEDGTLCLEEPEQAVKVNVIASTLYDKRDPANIQRYALAKVGTQYWMRENLRADRYTDGTQLEEFERLCGKPGYHKAESDGACYYSGEALLQEKSMNVEGWRIPSEEDWQKLLNYVDGNLSVLKCGEWEILKDESDEVAPVNNKSQLYIMPLGVWSDPSKEDTDTNINRGKMAAFWTWDYEGNCIADNTVFFIGGSNTIIESPSVTPDKDAPEGEEATFYKGLSIRLIRN